MGEVRWLSGPVSTLGAAPVSPWYGGDCQASTRRARLLEDGRIEIEGMGTVTMELPKAVPQWASLLQKYADQYAVPPQILGGILTVESGGNQKACNLEGGDGTCLTVSYNKKGKRINKGVGLMQLTDPSVKAGHSNAELLDDPDLNIMLGAKAFADQWVRYKGNLVKAIQAYNHGNGNCWDASTEEQYKKNPWGRTMAGNYVSDVIRATNGVVDSGMLTGNAPEPVLPGPSPTPPTPSPPAPPAPPAPPVNIASASSGPSSKWLWAISVGAILGYAGYQEYKKGKFDRWLTRRG